MDRNGLISEIDAEISRLEQARRLLTGKNGRSGPAAKKATTGSRKKRTLSPEARERIAAAQRARWAKRK